MFRKQLISSVAGVSESKWLKEREERSQEKRTVKDVDHHTKELGSEFQVINGKSSKVLIGGMTIPRLVF